MRHGIALDSSKISMGSMERILQKLIANQNRSSTTRNYITIWRSFNNFLLKLEQIPNTWEQRVSFYATYLVEGMKVQSCTLKSYVSAIKHILKCDGYEWSEHKL